MDAENKMVQVLLNDPAVSALVGDRIYNALMPATSVYPLIVYQQTGGERQRALRSLPGIEIARYQLDVWEPDSPELIRMVMQAIVNALDGYNAPQGEPQLSMGVLSQRLAWHEGLLFYDGTLEVLVQHDEQPVVPV